MSYFFLRHLSEGNEINETFDPVTSSGLKLKTITVKVGAAPTTSENLVLTLQSAAGTEYNVVIYTIDLSAASTTSVLSTDINLPLAKGDTFTLTYTNTDGNTIGVQVILSSGGD